MSNVQRRWYPLGGAAPGRQDAVPATAKAAKKKVPIDPLTGPKLALAGRVVTMDDAFTVKNDAVIYIEHGAIVAVQDRALPALAGFEAVAPVDTEGTIFPGLIELHNHLSYNALPLWSPVPKLFQHRGQWPDHPDYRKLISGPMTVVGKYRDAHGKPALLAPLVRYVECKCLLGGVTTSQGIMLNSNSGVQRFYRGIVRNVEQTNDPDLCEAEGRIADVDAKDARSFWARLKKEDRCFLLHLSEGVTQPGQTDSKWHRINGRSTSDLPASTRPGYCPRTSTNSLCMGARWCGRRLATCFYTGPRHASMRQSGRGCASAWVAIGHPQVVKTCSAS